MISLVGFPFSPHPPPLWKHSKDDLENMVILHRLIILSEKKSPHFLFYSPPHQNIKRRSRSLSLKCKTIQEGGGGQKENPSGISLLMVGAQPALNTASVSVSIRRVSGKHTGRDGIPDADGRREAGVAEGVCPGVWDQVVLWMVWGLVGGYPLGVGGQPGHWWLMTYYIIMALELDTVLRSLRGWRSSLKTSLAALVAGLKSCMMCLAARPPLSLNLLQAVGQNLLVCWGLALWQRTPWWVGPGLCNSWCGRWWGSLWCSFTHKGTDRVCLRWWCFDFEHGHPRVDLSFVSYFVSILRC